MEAGAQIQQHATQHNNPGQSATMRSGDEAAGDVAASAAIANPDQQHQFQQHTTMTNSSSRRQVPSNFSAANSYPSNTNHMYSRGSAGSHGNFVPQQHGGRQYQQHQYFGNNRSSHYGGKGNYSNDESFERRNYQSYDSRQNYKHDMNGQNHPKYNQNYRNYNGEFNHDVNNMNFQQRRPSNISNNNKISHFNKQMMPASQGFNPSANPMSGPQLVILVPPQQLQMSNYTTQAQVQYARMNQKSDVVKQTAEDKTLNDDLSKLLSEKIANLGVVSSDKSEKSSPVSESVTVKEKPVVAPAPKDVDLGELDSKISEKLTQQVLDKRINEQIVSTIKIAKPEPKPTNIKLEFVQNDNKVASVATNELSSSSKVPMETKTDAGNTNWSSSKLESTPLLESYPLQTNNDNMMRDQAKGGNKQQSNYQHKQNYRDNSANYSRQTPSTINKANKNPERVNLPTKSANVVPQPAKTKPAQGGFSFSNKRLRKSLQPIKSIPLADNSKVADIEVPVNSLMETNTTDSNTEVTDQDNTMASTSAASSKINSRTSFKSVSKDQDQTMSSQETPQVKPAPVEPPKPEIQKPQIETPKLETKPSCAVGLEAKFDLNDFIDNVVIFPVEECFENLPIIFRKFGSKSITFAKITNMDFEKDVAESYNIKQASSDLDKSVRELRGNLNKITEGNYRQFSEVVFKCVKNSPTDEITIALASAFYRKSIIDETYLNLYAKMIVKIQELGCSTFIYELTNYISAFVEPDAFNTDRIINLKEELKSAPTEKQEMLEEDLNIAVTQQKKRYTNNLKLVAYLFEGQFFDHLKVAEFAEKILSTKSEDLIYALVTAFGICGPSFFKGPNPKCGQVAENLRNLSKVSSNRLRFAIEDVLEKKEKQHFKLKEIPSNFQQGSTSYRTNVQAPKSSYTVNKSGSYTVQCAKKQTEMSAQAFDEITKQVTVDIKKYLNPFMHVKSKKFSVDQINKLSKMLLDEAACGKDQTLCNIIGDFLGEMIFNEQTKLESVLGLYGDYLDEESDNEWLIENKKIPTDFSLLLSHIFIKLVKSTKKISTFLSKKSLESLKVLFTGNNENIVALCVKSLDQELRQNMDNALYKELIVTCNLSPFLENV